MMKRFNQLGDTIVEVMVTTTVLSLVLATSFVAASHSLHSGVNAANRNQALQYAQQQVELLRVAINDGQLTTGSSNNIPSGDFYMTKTGPLSGDYTPQDPFTVKIRYDYDFVTNATTNNKTFSVAVQWPSSKASQPNQLVVYYQDPQDE